MIEAAPAAEFALTLAVGAMLLGAATIILLSALDFAWPYGASQLRYSVLPDRYYAALGFYALLALAGYAAILALLSWPALAVVCPPSNVTLDPRRCPPAPGIISAAAMTSVFLLVALPRIVGLRAMVGALRRSMHALARYPKSADTIAAMISRSQFTADSQAGAKLVGDLGQYGVPSRLTNEAPQSERTLSPASLAMLREVCCLHGAFARLRQEGRFPGFFSARKQAVDNIETEYSRLVRRAARAMLAADSVAAAEGVSDLILDLSEYIAEEGDALRAKYRRLLAEICLSCFSGRAPREKFFAQIGYDIFLPQPLPLIPLAIVCALDLFIGIAPVFLARHFGIGPQHILTFGHAAIFAVAHALALSSALFLAIWPKVVMPFARPSLFALPWRSYLVFGLASLLLGALIMYGGFRMIRMPPGTAAAHFPLLVSFIFAAIFLVTNLGVSILLDLRLREASLEYRRHRLRDGLALGAALALTLAVLIVALISIAYSQGLPQPSGWGIWAFRVTFIGLYAILGFAIGYLLPSAVEAHLEANQIIRASAEKSGKLVDVADRTPAPQPQPAL